MKILIYRLGMVDTNCYLVYDEKSRKACLIDPAVYDEKIAKTIDDKELSVEYIILTHGHFDHICGADLFKEKTGANIAAHELEAEYLLDPEKSLSSELNGETVSADILLKDGDVIYFGDISFKVMHTPGHTKGSSCFLCESEKVMFSGDTLFKGGVGRFDLYGGDYKILVESLQKLKGIDEDYIVYSGHGGKTMLDKEIAENYYFK